jgi:peroxiredoxin
VKRMKTRAGSIAAIWALPATVLIAGLAAGEPVPGEAPGALALGQPAPLADTKMKNVDGKVISIGEAKGAKGTLVIFTCNHCPWAKAWHSRIVGLGSKSLKRGIGVIAINPNDPAAYPEDAFATMQSNAKKSKMTFPYVVDATSDVARAFGATRTPEAFLFDAKGLLVYHGAIDDNAHHPDEVKIHYLEDAVNALLEGKEITLAETKALGCGIKFRTPKT